jgi:uncharacterized protein (DUF2267 family)
VRVARFLAAPIVSSVAAMTGDNHLPGVVGPGGPEPKLEWLKPGSGIVGALSARLGSDPRAEELVLAVMRSLRRTLPADTWEAVVDELPYSLRTILRSPLEVPPSGGLVLGWDPALEVGRAMQHPPERSALEVRAVFGAMKRALPRGLVDALSAELPPDVARAWLEAR